MFILFTDRQTPNRINFLNHKKKPTDFMKFVRAYNNRKHTQRTESGSYAEVTSLYFQLSILTPIFKNRHRKTKKISTENQQ